jgi:hypothetical protein
MKRLISIGLMALTLAVIAAQCSSAVQSATNDTGSQTVAETSVEEAAPAEESAAAAVADAEAESAEEIVAETSSEEVVEAEPVTDSSQETVAEESSPAKETAAESEAEVAEAEAVEEEAVAVAGGHEATCDDPFAGVESMRFNPRVWTAEQIARFVGPTLVDPASGLETNFCLHSVDYSEILSGGPPPDGIPPIDDPSFDSIETGDGWLADQQPVIALAVGDEAKAYPLAILTRHEIANDEIAGVPVTVTFCPLCNAAVVFKREINGEIFRFGVSGNLRNSDLIMWDNNTLSWWQQFTGQAIVGDMTGTQLEIVPAQLVAWKDFKAAFPNGQVLSNNGRNYGSNPYVGYDSSPRPFLFLGTPDERLPATERVLGYHQGDTAVAYPLPVITEEKIIADNIDGQDVVIFFEPGQVSALDQSSIEDSKEVGSAGMFIPEVDGQALTFSYNDGLIVDNETGSEWNVFGQAVSGELEGAQLQPIASHMHFWFAWAAFRPDTELFGS